VFVHACVRASERACALGMRSFFQFVQFLNQNADRLWW